MTGKDRRPSHSRVIRFCSIITIIAIGVAVTVGCVLLCGAAWLTVGIVYDLEVVKHGEALVDKEVAIDPSVLPEHPTEQDLYRISEQLMEDHGWGLAPNLTWIGASGPCQSNPEPDRFSVHFADAYLNSVVPYLKWAWISFDRNTNTASVSIEHQPLRWRHDTLDLSDINIGLYDALEIADRHGGRDYREDLNDKCRVYVSLNDHVWKITYKESGEPWSEQWIVVDSRTGKAKRAYTYQPPHP
jgi:hypothetical protein